MARTMTKYPRLYVSATTQSKVKAAAKKQGISQKEIGNKIAVAGLKALGLF